MAEPIVVSPFTLNSAWQSTDFSAKLATSGRSQFQHARDLAPIAAKGGMKRVEEVSKRKQPKSRNGCVTCKAKRMKCDEAKPSCQQCSRRGISCGGYRKELRWKAFGKSVDSNGNLGESKPDEESSEPQQSSMPPISGVLRQTDVGDRNTLFYRPKTQSAPKRPPRQSAPVPDGLVPASSTNALDQSPPMHSVELEPSNDDADAHISLDDDHLGFLGQIPSPLNDASNQTPKQPSKLASLDGFLDAINDINPELFDQQSPLPIYEVLQENDISLTTTSPNWQVYDSNDIDDLTEELQEDQAHTATFGGDSFATLGRIVSPPAMFEISRLRSGLSDRQGQYHLYRQPSPHSSGPEMMKQLFDHQTCGILSIRDEPTDNPWRTLIWPLVRDCPALYHAVSAMTCVHMSRTQPRLRALANRHIQASTQALAVSMDKGNVRLDAVLAAKLALAFADEWDYQKSSTGSTHINGAKLLLQQAISSYDVTTRSASESSRLAFLANTWIYLDVIARLTSVDDSSSTDLELIAACWHLNFAMPHQHIDPLMGCAVTLFPLIGRVADLVGRVRKRAAKRNSATIISQATELRVAIERWAPLIDLEKLKDPSSNISDSVQTAEAYRWATLLLLRQAVPELPFLMSWEDLAQKVMMFLATVPLDSRTLIVQIFPLLAAGCEATDEEDRDWVRQRWVQMSKRMITGIVDRCAQVTKEVWRRRDEHDVRCLSCLGSLARPLSSIAASGASPNGLSACRCSPEVQARLEFSDFPDSAAFKKGADPVTRSGSVDYTVKGKLHWLGVMRDWEWEVMLG